MTGRLSLPSNFMAMTHKRKIHLREFHGEDSQKENSRKVRCDATNRLYGSDRGREGCFLHTLLQLGTHLIPAHHSRLHAKIVNNTGQTIWMFYKEYSHINKSSCTKCAGLIFDFFDQLILSIHPSIYLFYCFTLNRSLS